MSKDFNELRNLGHRSHHEWLNEGKEWVVDEIYAPDCEIINRAVPDELRHGREAFKAYGRSLRTAFPDMKIVNEDIVFDGKHLLIRWSMTGTHLGPYYGIPPTGRPVAITGDDIMVLNDEGQIRQLYLEQDLLNLLAQMGLIPS
jgi:predicted ester cyclase